MPQQPVRTWIGAFTLSQSKPRLILRAVLALTSAGNVGINSTSPGAKLDIVQGTDALGASLVANSNTSNNIMNITGNALTTGIGLNISSSGTGMTTGSLLSVSTATTAGVATNGIVSF